MKISIARMIANLTARGRAYGNRFAWWSRWFPPAPTVDADRFQAEGDPTRTIGRSSRGPGLLATLEGRRRCRLRWPRCPIRGAG